MGIERPLLLDFPTEWRGERVLLRTLRDEDAQPMFDAIRESAERIAQWMPWPKYHQTVDDTVEWIRRQQASWIAREGFQGIGIFDVRDGRYLGGTGMHVLDWQIGSFEIGYWLREGAEGHGYISEAARLLTMFAFTQLHAERVMIRCDARNERSKHVPERLGFVFEGRLRHDSLGVDGAIRDTLVFAMIPEDFMRARIAWGV